MPRWSVALSLFFQLLFHNNNVTVVNADHDSIAAVTASKDGKNVFCISRGNVLGSEDGGFSWQRKSKGMSCNLQDGDCGRNQDMYVVASPNYEQDNTLFFGNAKHGLQRSKDGGNNYSRLGEGQFEHCLGKGHISMSPGFVGAPEDEDNPTTSSTTTTTTTTSSSSSSNSGVMLLVAMDKTVQEGWYHLYRSQDGGNSFDKITLAYGALPNAGELNGCSALFSVSEEVHFLGTKTGDLLASTDTGLTWDLVAEGAGRGQPIQQILGTGIVGFHKPNFYTFAKDLFEIFLMTPHALIKMTFIEEGDTLQLHQTQTLRQQDAKHEEQIRFVHALAHPGRKKDTTTLLLMAGTPKQQQLGEDAQVEIPPLFIAQEKGSSSKKPNWKSVLHYQLQAYDPVQDIVQDSDAPFYDAWGLPGTDVLLLGTYQGLFRSEDKGKSWKFLDTVGGWITGISVGPSNGPNFYFVDFCTNRRGCFGDRVELLGPINPDAPLAIREQLRANTNTNNFNNGYLGNPISTVQLQGQGGFVALDELPPSQYDGVPKDHLDVSHEIVAISPNHNYDGIILRSTQRNDNAQRLERSRDNFHDSHTYISIPALYDDNEPTMIHSIVFSPNFANDQTIFCAGPNIGLAVSKDNANTFQSLWDPHSQVFKGTITTIAISPNYAQDQTIAVLVHWSEFNDNRYATSVHLSTDAGQSFQNISGQTHQWVHLKALQGKNGEFVLMSLHMHGTLAYWKGGEAWDKVEDTHFGAYPSGFADNSLASFGTKLAIAMNQGNVLLLDSFENGKFESRKFSNTPETEDVKFVYAENPEYRDQGIGSLIAFSPIFNEDSIIFGASYYSLYASYDQGLNWEEIFRLPHNNHGRLAVQVIDDFNDDQLQDDDETVPSYFFDDDDDVDEEQDDDQHVPTVLSLPKNETVHASPFHPLEDIQFPKVDAEKVFQIVGCMVGAIAILCVYNIFCKRSRLELPDHGVFQSATVRSFGSDEWEIGDDELSSSDEDADFEEYDDDIPETLKAPGHEIGRVHIYF